MEKWKCKFCDKVLNLKNKYTKSGHLAKCIKFKTYKGEVLTKEYLIKQYIEEERSALEIALNHNLESASTIIKLLKIYDIPTRNIKESKNDREKAKRKSTNIKKYGEEHNFSKNHPSRLKWEEDLYKNEGITNVFQRPDIIDDIKIKTMETKYERGLAVRPELMLDKQIYNNKVQTLTESNYKNYFNLINPDQERRGHSSFHIDHKVSKQFGFINNIPPEIIAHPCNLEMLYYKDNLAKNFRCSFTIEELMIRIKEYENINSK